MNNLFLFFWLGLSLFSYHSDVLILDDLEVCINGPGCTTTVTLLNPDPVGCSQGYILEVITDLPNPTADQLVYDLVPPGTYSVTYTQTDTCGTSFSDSFAVEVLDCAAPLPFCEEGMLIEFQSNQFEIQLPSEIFDDGSFDNCGGPVVLSFSSDSTDTVRAFYCPDDLGLHEIELWVTDASGNQDFCETFVFFQANIPCEIIPEVWINNKVLTEEEAGISGVEITHEFYLNSSIVDIECITDENGDCSIYELIWGVNDIVVVPRKDEEYRNGVTTSDMALILKHILGIELLDSPYKIIAADVNNDGHVSTSDLIPMQLLILGLIDGFPNNTSWRFVDAEYEFSNPMNPWSGGPFPEIVGYFNVALPGEAYPKFFGLKVGDVNNTANPD